MAVSRVDWADLFQRQPARTTTFGARASEGAARFSLDGAERKAAPMARPTARRPDTASAARIEPGRTDRSDKAGSAEVRQEARQEARQAAIAREEAARTRSAQAKPAPAKPAQDEAGTGSRPVTGAGAKAAAARPDRTHEGPGSAQERSAEASAAEEVGATQAPDHEDETEEADETAASREAAAAADPSALLAPPPAPTPAAPTASSIGSSLGSSPAPSATEAGEVGSIEGGTVAASAGLGHGGTGAAEGATTGRDGAAGFDAVLEGTQAGAQAGAQDGTQAASNATGAASALAPPSGVTGGTAGTAAAQATQATGVPPSNPPIPLGAVPMTIGLRSLSGVNRFAIRLDPVELGRIDVSLDLDKAGGKARAHLVVDRPETLALLQRDAGTLQQALAQAGFDVAAEAGGGGIDLSLRNEAGGGGRDGESASRDRSDPVSGGRTDTASPLDLAPLRPLRAVSGLDIRI